MICLYANALTSGRCDHSQCREEAEKLRERWRRADEQREAEAWYAAEVARMAERAPA